MEWSNGRFRTFITGVLRSGFRKFPSKYETLKEASVGKKINKKTNRMAEHFKCNGCGEEFPAKEVQVDHLQPVVCPVEGFIDWNTYIKRMYCGKDNLQVLCSGCHDVKSASERKIRQGNKHEKT
jgi:5-methylcytosine-specific restriction endonuclease McrA